jgi:SOS-response transcriptional repressor LexA
MYCEVGILEFHEALKDFTKRRSLSMGQLTTRVKDAGGYVNRSYWSPLMNGTQRPSRRLLEMLTRAFPQDPEIPPLWEMAGIMPGEADRALFPPPPEVPPGLLPLTTVGRPMRVFGTTSATSYQSGQSTTTEIDPAAEARSRGAEWAFEVNGDCLEPELRTGDLVAVKPTNQPEIGEYVLVRRDGEHLTLKVWTMRDGRPWLDVVNPNHEGFSFNAEVDQIVGVAVYRFGSLLARRKR